MKFPFLLMLLLILITSCDDINSIFGEEETTEEVNTSGDNLTQPLIINTTNATEENTTTIKVIEENVFLPPKRYNLSIYILDVDGQSIIVLQKDTSLLMDSGFERDAQIILKRLRNLGIDKLDYAIASNTNEGSIGGLPYIIIQTSPAKIYEAGISSSSSSYITFKDLYSNTTKVSNDMMFSMEYLFVKLIVAYDDGKGFAVDSNDNSIATRINYEDTNFLFMSNCGFECIERIDVAESNALVIDGSCDSTTLSFIQKVKPEVAIVNGEVCQETKDRFNYLDIPLYTTQEHGDIRLESDGESFSLKYLKSR